ncbi:MAG: 3-deoxy-manno-octulosonate cytidylyltransferase [Promethearchaeota archaeon]
MNEKETKAKKIVCIVPSRYGSSRLPGKPLADLGGKTVVQRTYEKAKAAVDRVIVATDDERIADVVKKFGGEFVMTRDDHESGSDRIAEVAEKIDADIIVNVQGDEPFLDPRQIGEALEPLLNDDSIVMSTLSVKIVDEEELKKPGVVKVVSDLDGNALYFSRSIIPYPRKPEHCEFFEHVGIYVYRKDFLLKFVSWQPTKLELAEGLEQMRVMEHGYKIRVIETKYPRAAPCIDTPEDLEQAREYLKNGGQ